MNFKKFLFVSIILAVIGGIGYVGVKKILSLKNNPGLNGDTTFTLEQSKGSVLGISSVPEFPNSKFLFEQHLDNDVVQQFLARGKSAYLLPIDAEWEDVVAFYKEGLEEKGWTHVLSVDLSDETKMFGEYWVIDSQGLRIYSKLDDVWYELISTEQANTGLADRVAKDEELQMFLAMNSGEEIPENLPWSLTYSPEWTAEIGKSKLLEIEFIQFENSDGDQNLIIEPIEFVTLQPLRDVGVGYIDTANEYRDEQDQFKVISIDPVEVAGQEAYKFVLESEEDDGYYCVVANSRNDVIYVIRTFTGSASFFTYVLSNLEINDGEKD